MICPMKISALANSNISFESSTVAIDNFLKCSTKDCAWYCVYPNGIGECAIHSLPGLFDGLDSIATQIANK